MLADAGEAGLGLFGHSQDDLLDGARQLRAQLQQTPAGGRLMQVYVDISNSGELETLINRDPQLQLQCLSFACVVDRSRQMSAADAAPLQASLLQEAETIIGALHARSSASTRARTKPMSNGHRHPSLAAGAGVLLDAVPAIFALYSTGKIFPYP